MVDLSQVLALLADSSDDDDDDDDLPDQSLWTNEDDDLDVVNILQPVLRIIGRAEHVKIPNYVENQARNFIENDFIVHFRLSRKIAYILVGRFENSPVFKSLRTVIGFEPVTPEIHILCYLWFVGHENVSYQDVADRFDITLSTLDKIISRVTKFLLTIAGDIIKFPTSDERQATKEYYLAREKFPGVVGSINGSHVRINKPVDEKNSYLNRNQYYSIHIQGVADHKKKFLDVFIGYPGSVHDARVFRESTLFENIEELCGEDGFLLGDCAYPCMKHLIVPYRDNGHLGRDQINFNEKLDSCRVAIDRAFIGLKQRFRLLLHLKFQSIVRTVQVIHACCVLHNLADANDLKLFENDPIVDVEGREYQVENFQIYNPVEVFSPGKEGRTIRDEICRQLARR